MAESKQEVGGRVERMCQPCLYNDIKRSANVFCPTCNEFQCNACTNGHKMYAFMRDHKLLSVEEGLSQVDTNKVDMKGIDICKKHNKRFKFFCEDDKTLACSKCAIIDHRNCKKIVDIESITERDQCDKLRENLQTAVFTTNEAVESLKRAESCLSNDVQSVPDKLSKMRSNIMLMFDDFAEKVTKVANSYRDNTTTDWAKRKLECETKIATIKSYLETIDNMASNGTPSQQFITACSMTETVQDEVKNAGSLCTEVWTLNVSCKFDEQFDTLRSGLLSAMTLGEFEMKYSVRKKTKLEPIVSIDLKQTGDVEEESLFSGLDFLPDGRLVAVDNANYKCSVYDENLNLKSVYTLPYHPRSVAVVSDEEVAITTKRRLYFLHVGELNEITLKRTCKVNVQCSSLSMKDDEEFVASVVDNNTPVRIVSMSGGVKDFDIVFQAMKYPVGASSCAYIRGQDKIVLTDRDADIVYVYAVKTGEKVVIKDELIKAPRCVAIGPNDHVFVGSNRTSSLVEITPGGRVLSSYQVDMNYPSYLAISKDRRRLAVSNADQGSKTLKIYQILSE